MESDAYLRVVDWARRHCSQSATPWNILWNWLVLALMLVGLLTVGLRDMARLHALGLLAALDRRTHEKVRSYQAARQAGSPDVDRLGVELGRDIVSHMVDGRPNP